MHSHSQRSRAGVDSVIGYHEFYSYHPASVLSLWTSSVWIWDRSGHRSSRNWPSHSVVDVFTTWKPSPDPFSRYLSTNVYYFKSLGTIFSFIFTHFRFQSFDVGSRIFDNTFISLLLASRLRKFIYLFIWNLKCNIIMHSVCSKYFPLSRRYLFYRQQCTTFSMPRYPFWWGCDLSLQTTLAFPQRWTQIFIFPLTENSYFWFQVNLCMVDIDNDRITIPEDLPTFPQHKELADELREVLTKLQQAPTVPTNSTINSSSSYYYFQNFFPSSINLTYVFFVTGINNVSRGHLWLWQVELMHRSWNDRKLFNGFRPSLNELVWNSLSRV